MEMGRNVKAGNCEKEEANICNEKLGNTSGHNGSTCTSLLKVLRSFGKQNLGKFDSPAESSDGWNESVASGLTRFVRRTEPGESAILSKVLLDSDESFSLLSWSMLHQICLEKPPNVATAAATTTISTCGWNGAQQQQLEFQASLESDRRLLKLNRRWIEVDSLVIRSIDIKLKSFMQPPFHRQHH